MKFDIITIFPDFFDSFVSESIIKRAQKRGLIKIKTHNLRDFAPEPHRVVDDRPFGGGIGMVIKVEPVYRAIQSLKSSAASAPAAQQQRVILFTPRGKKFNQKKAAEYSELDQLIMICGRYEGVDERVAKYIADEKISIGNYVLLGGELAAMTVIESVSRLIPGVIGKKQLLKERQTKEKGFIEYPQYTRPPKFFPKELGRAWKVPKVLLSGHHKEIEEWRKKHSKTIK